MTKIEEIIEQYKSVSIAIYGLGTETQRFLADHGDKISVTGLLDGFRTEGQMYGYPIIPIEDTVKQGVKLIIVVARPGSCKAIAKRISGFCRENGIALFDARGKDLLQESAAAYDFSGLNAEPKDVLLGKIERADVVSFDLMDTLFMRKVMSYTDVFELLGNKLEESGIHIPEFASLRLAAEKECSKGEAPTLETIYGRVLELADYTSVSATELADMEWEIDKSLIVPRYSVCELYRDIVRRGKKVVITTDNYYTKDRIASLLSKYDLGGYSDLFVSCDIGTSKTQKLFERVSEETSTSPDKILHIGDDEFADVEKAEAFGINTFRIYSATDFFDHLGGLGLEKAISDISDRVKAGMFLSRIFNDPFCFERADRRLKAEDASDVGFLFCAPMITDFTLWMQESISRQGYKQIIFGARDGYLFEKLYEISYPEGRSCYFLTSRTAAIRAGMETQEDIDYVDGMKYSGTLAGATSERFGIDVKESDDFDRSNAILEKAKDQRENYRQYIDKLGIGEKKLAFFDFVAKGTTQMYLQKLFEQHLKGFYFLQLEPEFMADKGLDIEPFYFEEEKDSSAIFDNYYILETILTAPFPQMKEMGPDGEPVYAKETRSERDLKCFERAQNGIIEYYKEYLRIVPKSARTVNKKLDEKLLELVNKVKILDEDFLALKVEDPFFGRMTAMTDVIG